jgi:hypothetical protein
MGEPSGENLLSCYEELVKGRQVYSNVCVLANLLAEH